MAIPSVQEKVSAFVDRFDQNPGNKKAERIEKDYITPQFVELFRDEVLATIKAEDRNSAKKLLLTHIPAQKKSIFVQLLSQSATALLEEGSKSTVKETVQNLLKRADVVFIGEDHIVADENIFTPVIADAYQSGTRYLAVEINGNEQSAMDHFVSTGDISKFTDHSQFMAKPEVQKLFKAAAAQGIKIICVDQNTSERTTYEERDRFIGKQIAKLMNQPEHGKVIVWMGAEHAAKRTKPYPTARSIVETLGYRTAGIRTESQTVIDYERQHASFYRQWSIDTTHNAFKTYFTRTPPRSTFTYPTKKMGNLKHVTPVLIGAYGGGQKERFEGLYQESYDAIVFLSKIDGGDKASGL